MKEPELFKLIRNFVFEVMPIVEEAIPKRYYPPTYDKYPRLRFRSNGMPDIDEYGESLININKLFQSFTGKSDIDLDTIDSYNEAFDYLLNHEAYRKYSYFPYGEEPHKNDFFKNATRSFLIDILERYYLLNKEKVENEKLLEDIYLPNENYLFSETLSFDISIPILFIHFDFEDYSISNNIIIRKIKDEYHLSRLSIKSYSPPITSSLLSCATHELVLKNYTTENKNIWSQGVFDRESAYPHDKIELFFNALKTISDHNSGYAQLLIYPHSWIPLRCDKDLPYLTGTSTKRYPNYFDDFYWNAESLPNISLNEVTKIGTLYLKFLETTNNKLKIANKRLRYSYLRDNEEDSILDIIIALETLLSDGDKGELTHKLSLRMAILLSTFCTHEPLDVFNSVKKIYNFRSKVVHGENISDSKKEIKLSDSHEPIRIILLASKYLRETIEILTNNPIYLDSKKIDELMITKNSHQNCS